MNEKEQPSPEQLLKMLDLQMEASRQARTGRSNNRTTMRVLSLGIVLLILFGALWVLMTMLEDVRANRAEEAVPVEKQ
jgi:flagellar biogenesis protein FliO